MTDVSDRSPSPMQLAPLQDPFGVLRRVMQPRERAAPGERCGGRLSGTRLFRIRSILRGKTGLLVAAKQYGPGYLAYTHNSP